MTLFYEICQKIWGGSPSTTQITAGVETDDVQVVSPTPVAVDTAQEDIDNPPAALDSADELTEDVISSRRPLLDDKLKTHKQERLKRKASIESQTLALAQEDLQMKKKLFDRMAQVDNDHSKTMESLNSNMARMTESISSGFSMLQTLLAPQPAMPLSQHTHLYTHAQGYATPHTMRSQPRQNDTFQPPASPFANSGSSFDLE